MSQKNDLVPPEPSAADRAYSLVRAALSAIPAIGDPATELLSMLITPRLERRRQIWMEEVGKGLSELLSRNLVTPEELLTSDAFVDTVLQASQVAMRTANEEKLAALKNAILNSALPEPPDESIRLMFLALVDQFTPWHLRMLKLFNNPGDWVKLHWADVNSTYYLGGLSDIFERAFPEMNGKREFYDQVWADLYQKGLVNTDNLHAAMTGRGLIQKRTSDLGDRFLAFLEEPKSSESDA